MIAFVGVDAGGSHTEAAVAGPDLAPLARSRGPSGRLDPTIDDPANPVVAVVRSVCEQAAVPLPATAAVVGAAGAGTPELQERLRDALTLAGIAHRVAVTTDLEIAFCAAFEAGPGMLISAGTGSVAAARDATGAFTRVGGYGWRVGDEGSAAALGRSAMGAALRAEDRRGQHTRLVEALRAHLRAAGPLGQVQMLRAAGPGDFAALVPTVIATAQTGDTIANELIANTVTALVGHVTALRVSTHDEAGRTVALNGGLLAPGSAIRETFVYHLARAHPDLEVRTEPVDPVRGALLLAHRLSQVNGLTAG